MSRLFDAVEGHLKADACFREILMQPSDPTAAETTDDAAQLARTMQRRLAYRRLQNSLDVLRQAIVAVARREMAAGALLGEDDESLASFVWEKYVLARFRTDAPAVRVSWIRTALRNRRTDLLRKAKAREEVNDRLPAAQDVEGTDHDALADIVDPGPTPEASSIENDVRNQFKEALALVRSRIVAKSRFKDSEMKAWAFEMRASRGYATREILESAPSGSLYAERWAAAAGDTHRERVVINLVDQHLMRYREQVGAVLDTLNEPQRSLLADLCLRMRSGPADPGECQKPEDGSVT